MVSSRTLSDIWDDMSLEQQDSISRMICNAIRYGYFDPDNLYTQDREIYRHFNGEQRRLANWIIGKWLEEFEQ